MNPHIQKISHNNELIAIIVDSNFKQEGIAFFTENYFSQQLGYMNRPAGHVILPHRHHLHKREITQTQEVLFVRSGKVRVDFYAENHDYLESAILSAGDIIILVTGGHGFVMLEPSEMIEVKQGPYVGEKDKVRFEQVEETNVNITYHDRKL